MLEILLVLTLVAAMSTAGLLAVFLMRARTAEREAREELSRSLATFSQTLTAQMGSNAHVQNAQFETLRGAGHNDTLEVGGRAYLERLRRFLDEVAP